MWTLGGTRIFVQELNDEAKQVIARLIPLASGTVIQTFGYDDLIKNLNVYIVGSVDKTALINMTRTGNTYTLSGMGFNWGDYYVNKASFSMVRTTCQTLRPDLAEDASVYIVDLELYKDE